MRLLLLLSWLSPLMAGLLLADYLGPRQRNSAARFLLTLVLGLGASIGISSCTFFITLVLSGAPRLALLLGETGFFVGLMVLVLWRRFDEGQPGPSSTPPTPTGHSIRLLVVAPLLVLLAAVISAVVKFVSLSLQAPHGQYDAWFIWNLRARFLFRSNEHWADSFSPLLAHADYPLLLPATVARGWKYLGQETSLLPMLLGLAFTLGTVCLLAAALGVLRGKCQGVLAALVLLATPFFVPLGSWQCADTPLGFYILASLAAVCLHHECPQQGARTLMLAGMMAGFAAWTKNEGLLFAVLLVAAHLAATLATRGWEEYDEEGGTLLLGFVPAGACLLVFKLWLAPATDLFAGQSLVMMLDRLRDGSRYFLVGRALLTQQVIGPGLIVLLLVYRCLLGRAPRARRPDGSFLCLVILAGMLLGYVVIYLISPQELAWHLRTSLRRLLMQLWPATLFIFFLRTATPEAALARVQGFAGWSPKTAR